MSAAVVFDLDGTLVCLPINWEALFDESKQIMHVESARPLVDTVSKVDEQTRVEVFAAWDKAELAVAKNSTVCKEGMRIYKENWDKPRALVTLQGKKAVQVVLKKFALNFDAVVTREDSLSRAKQLRMVIEKLKVPVEDVLFVGNAYSDANAAHDVGCQFRQVK